MSTSTTKPVHTPWGAPERAPEAIAPGIWSYVTQSHGGIWLEPELNAQVPEAWRAVSWGGGAASGWYEEDCDWVLVVLAFPTCFDAPTRDMAQQIFASVHQPRLAQAAEVVRIVTDLARSLRITP